MLRQSDDFMEILTQLYDRLDASGAQLFHGSRDIITDRAKQLLASPDTHYLPGYKLTELMADLINIAATISAEGWLSHQEAIEHFIHATSDNSPLVLEFMATAKMERARYEPIMLTQRYDTPQAERNEILRVRLKRMLLARQSHDPLPHSFVRAIRIAGHRAIHAPCFATYRIGPMLQFFCDMIKQAEHIHITTYDEMQGVAILNHTLREESPIWKLYRHKAARFSAKPDDPLHNNHFPTRATMLYVPDRPGRPTLH